MASATFELRAVDQTKQAFASVQNSLERLDSQVSKVGKGFQLGNILKDVLRGFGIGSGFQVIQSGVDYIIEQRNKEAEIAELVTKEVEKQLALTKELIAMKQTPAQQIDTLKKERTQLEERRDLLLDEKRRTFTPPLEPGWAFMSKAELEAARTKKVVAALTNEQQLALAKLRTEIMEVTKKIDALTISEDELAKKERERIESSDQSRRRASFAAGMKRDEEEFDKLLKAAQESNLQSQRSREEQERLQKQVAATAEHYRQMADPLRVFKNEMAEVDKLESDGILTMQEADDIRDAIDVRRGEAARHLYDSTVEVTEQVNVLAMAANDVAASFASAFESAVLGGDKLSDVMRNLARDIIGVFLRLSVTNNLINAMFGGVTGFQKLPAFEAFSFKAKGGPVNAGSPYIVGEEGPELFIPRSEGTIIPNGAMNSKGSLNNDGATNGSSVNVTYNIAAGVTRSELVPILETERKRLKAEIPDMVRRGGAYRAAFA